MFRIAVIGGGIGGLFAALSIHHHCSSDDIRIDVYEQAAQYKEIGAGVAIGPNGARLIEKLGLLEEAWKIAGKRGKDWFSFRRYDTGAEVLTVPIPETGRMLQLPMHRAEFLDLLVRAVEARGAATLHTDKQCQTLEDRGDEMSVTFADGTAVTANLVIGADGIHSAVRRHYVNDNARYGEMVVYRGLCAIADVEDIWPVHTYATIWMAPGKHFLTFPICDNQVLNVVGFVSTPLEKLGQATESWTLKGEKSEVREEFKEFAPAVLSVIDKMETNPLKWILFDREPLDQWSFSGGKVALLGDAAHAMCPHQGAGAGQAMEDGYILGRTLRDYFDAPKQEKSLASAMQLYQTVRHPRAVKVQSTSRQAGDVYELRAAEFAELSYDDGLPIAKTMLEHRMKWIWGDDIDRAFEQTRDHAHL
ncbi:FAD/NAD(P)-binding domain-containing protein [Coniochaeta hoffmannii]|uniref:FAD/NAD(P)-binding domain-containing protein n=1 Tax=Coniochaeta hoffmannii TaxID=91930 RepID=A0AA38SBG6_9PEZI|nr:FAD/NAD(P)-binding domain-containing protein [Coniochaeta hoffmannii]